MEKLVLKDGSLGNQELCQNMEFNICRLVNGETHYSMSI